MSPLVVAGRIQGFAWEPGRNSGYRAGRSLRWGGCCHQTAGSCAGDRSILSGLGGAYIPRDPGCGPGATQFSEIDAVAFTQCEWNDELMPCEVEWLPGQDFTGYQIDKCGLFVAAGIELGVPDVRLDPAGRVPIGARIGGFIDHRKLQHRACAEHNDGWYAHWPAIRAAAATYLGAGAPGGKKANAMLIQDTTTEKVWLIGVGAARWVLTVEEMNELKYIGVPDVGRANSLTVIHWMMLFGAWDKAGNKPREVV